MLNTTEWDVYQIKDGNAKIFEKQDWWWHEMCAFVIDTILAREKLWNLTKYSNTDWSIGWGEGNLGIGLLKNLKITFAIGY